MILVGQYIIRNKSNPSIMCLLGVADIALVAILILATEYH